MADPNNSYEMANISAEARPTPPNSGAHKTSYHLKNRHESVHWKVPLLMAGSFVLGLALAVAHHLFYTALDGRVVQDQTEQQWYGRIGTGLAFLVKTLLVMAVSVACVQNMWRALKSKPMSLGGVDSLFDVLSNAWSLSSWRLWLDVPAVVILATIAWLIPLAAVVAPPTLTVHIVSELAENVQVIRIPSLDLAQLHYGRLTDQGVWVAPQPDISRMALTVATQGSVLNIAARFPNSTYTLNFFGPALRCDDANETVYRDLSKQAEEFFPLGPTPTAGWLSYMAFVPMLSMHSDDINSIIYAINATLHAQQWETNYRTLDIVSNDMARLYVGVLRGGSNYTVYECALYNSSYLVEFRFNDGIQSLEIRNLSHLHGVPRCYAYACFTETPNVLAYMSIMDSVGEILEGYSFLPYHSGERQVRTRIQYTTLFDTKKMRTRFHATSGSSTTTSNAYNKSLSSALQELVQNITLSLFSSSRYLEDNSSASPINVTIRSPQNIYFYSPKNLVLAYGIASLFSLVGVVLGFWCLSVNGASYSNSFSTVLRTTRNLQLDTAVRTSETNGADPLPQHLARIKVSLQVLSTDGSGQSHIAIALALACPSQSPRNTSEGRLSAVSVEVASDVEAPRLSLSLDTTDLDVSAEVSDVETHEETPGVEDAHELPSMEYRIATAHLLPSHGS